MPPRVYVILIFCFDATCNVPYNWGSKEDDIRLHCKFFRKTITMYNIKNISTKCITIYWKIIYASISETCSLTRHAVKLKFV